MHSVLRIEKKFSAIDMKEAYPSASWTNVADGSTVSWLANEHCLVLVGYDRDSYYCNDPYESRGLVAIPREQLESRFKALGCQALAVIPEDI